MEFEKVGIREGTTFSGFCSLHDNLLFSPIDNVNVDLKNEKNLLLFNYWATIQENVNKLNKKETYQLAFDRFKFYDYPLNPYFDLRIGEIGLDEEVNDWYSNELLKSFELQKHEFLFRVIDIPYVEVIASELVTFEPPGITGLKRRLFDVYRVVVPFSNLYMQIIPDSKKEHTSIILSMHKNDQYVLAYLFDYFKSLNPEKMLSDFLLLYFELWVGSENFYNHNLKPLKEDIERIFIETAKQSAIERETKVNIFNTSYP